MTRGGRGSVRRGLAGGWLALLLAAGSGVGCAPGGGTDGGPDGEASLGAGRPAPRWNVLLIVIDTLRADHLSSYGYERDTSPALDAFAAEAVLFENARSQAGCTFPSANSILTSRRPARFLGQPDGFMGIPDGIGSLAERLSEAGYSTLAVSASPIVRRSPSRFNPDGGFGRGFDQFDEACVWRAARCVNQAFGRWLPALEPPFFVYLHYMEPHGPYRPPADHRMRFARPYEGKDFIAAGDPNPIADMLYKEGPQVEVEERDLEHLVDLYDEEIAFFDDRFPSILGRLEKVGHLDDTIIVIASDHGEEFLEHGHVKHCHSVYDSLVRTPLVVRLPASARSAPGSGAGAARRVAAAVENLDIVPTVYDYLGLDAEGLEGKSLRPWLDGAAPPEAPHLAFSSQGPWRSVTDGRHKLHYHLGTGQLALYDLATDPGETRPIPTEGQEAFRRLRRALFEHLVAVEGSTASQQALDNAAKAEERLRALGYL